ncbi:MAG: hypothetical protein IPM82_29815 [Saprospiraceae bacterium]|nr:hypothetical protein [Saprospiraceae bacterium]
MDAYDAPGASFWVVLETAGEAVPIGYLRITGNDCQETAYWVCQLAAQYQFSDAINVRPILPLPMMKYFSSASEKINQYHQNIHSKGGRLMEGGRMCLLPEYESLRLARFLIESAVVFVLFHKQSNAILSCKERQLPVYAGYGFKPLEGISKQKVASHDSLVLVLRLSEKSQQSESLMRKYENMLDQYEQTGQFSCPVPVQQFATLQSLCA